MPIDDTYLDALSRADPDARLAHFKSLSEEQRTQVQQAWTARQVKSKAPAQETPESQQARGSVSVNVGAPQLSTPQVSVDVGTPQLSGPAPELADPGSQLSDAQAESSNVIHAADTPTVQHIAQGANAGFHPAARAFASKALGIPDDVLEDAGNGNVGKLRNWLRDVGVDPDHPVMSELVAGKLSWRLLERAKNAAATTLRSVTTPAISHVATLLDLDPDKVPLPPVPLSARNPALLAAMQGKNTDAALPAAREQQEAAQLEAYKLQRDATSRARLLYNDATNWLADEKGLSERDKAEAQAGLTAAFGPFGAKAARFVASQAGQLPLYALLPEGWIAKGGKIAEAGAAKLGVEAASSPILSRIVGLAGKSAGGAAVGAVAGAEEAALDPNKGLVESTKHGAEIGAVVAPLASVAMGAVKFAGKKVLGLLTSDGAEMLGAELRSVTAQKPVEVTKFEKPVAPAPPTPSFATVEIKDGKPVGRIYGIGSEGAALLSEHPLESASDALDFHGARREHQLQDAVNMTADVLRHPEVTKKGRQWYSNLFDGGDSVPTLTDKQAEAVAKGGPANMGARPTIGPEAKTAAQRRGRVTEKTEVQAPRKVEPLDKPPSGPAIGPQVITQEAGEAPEPAPQQPPAPALTGEEPTDAQRSVKIHALPEEPRTPEPLPVKLEPLVPPDNGVRPGDMAQAHKEGDLVYVQGSGAQTGTYTTAKVIGPGEAPGTVQVDVGAGNTRTVDAGSLWPANYGAADPKTLAAPQIPLPGEAPGPGQLPPHLAQQASTVLGLMSRFGAGVQDLGDKLRRAFFGKGLTGPQDLAQQVQSILASQAIQDTSMDAFRALRSRLKGLKGTQLLGQFDKDFLAYVQGRGIDMSKHGETWDAVKELADNMLRERDALDKRIADLGGIPDDLIHLRENGEVDRYVARHYLARVMGPGEWAKRVPADVMGDALAFLRKQADARGIHISDHELALNLHEIVRAPNPLDAFQGNGVMKGALGHLERLSDIPEPLRKAMGEVESGQYRLATTLGTQRAVAANLELMANLSSDRTYYSPGPRADLHPVPLPNNPRYYGKAAGGYVHPDIYDALVNVPKTLDSVPAILRTLQGHMKGNLIGANPGALLHHTMANVWHSVLAGGLDVMRPVESGRAMKEAWSALRGYGAGLTELGTPGALALEARRYGALRPGLGAAEIQTIQDQFANHFDKVLGQRPATFWDFAGKWNGAVSTYKSAQAHLGHLYDMNNDLFKLANYAALRRKFLAAGMDVGAAAANAAHRVNLSFPDASNLGSAVNSLRNTVGVGAPFLTPIAEEARIHALLPQRMLSEPDLKWRVGATALLTGALFGAGAAARHMNGISDEEVDAGMSELTRRQKSFRPALAVAPWRDSQGRLNVYDLTHFSYAAKLLNGNPDDAMWRRVMANVLTSPLSQTAGDGVNKVLEKAGLIHPLPDYKPLPGEQDVTGLLSQIQGSGFGAPEIVSRVQSALRKGGVTVAPPPTKEPFTPAQMAQEITGLPFAFPVTAGPGPSHLASTKEDIGKMRELQGAVARAASTGRTDLIPGILEELKGVGRGMGSRGEKERKLEEEKR